MKHFIAASLLIAVLLSIGWINKGNELWTVTGPVSEDSLGFTLIHEHILVDFIGANKTGYHRWNRDEVVKKVLPYLLEAKNHGVNTMLECTPAYLGRDPLLLKRLSELSGINILTNTGFYGAVQDKYVPEFAFEIDADSMADIWTSEFKHGIEGTGIRPGFIKVSVDTNATLSQIDEKIVRAAIKTHRRTGLTIVSHTGPDGPAFAQLKLLGDAGISPQAWVWTHAQAGTPEGHLFAANKGAWISIDNVNKENISSTLDMLMNLRTAGFLEQVLISQDAGYYKPDNPDAEDFRGYTDILVHLIPALKENGFTEADIRQLFVLNPINAYTPRVRYK